MAAQTRIAELASQIAANTAKVDQYLQVNGLPEPSFEEHGPMNLEMPSKEVEDARVAAICAAMELQDLLSGPFACLRPCMHAASLEAIYRWRIPQHVPVNGEISLPDLATQVGISEPNLRRILRFAIIHHRVFREPRIGYIAHSAASRLLVDNEAVFDCLGMMFDESWQTFARTCDALEKFNGDEPDQTGYQLVFNESMWQHYKTHPSHGKRFANSMRAMTAAPGQSLASIAANYPWQSLPVGSVIVDVGGSDGHVSVAIARKHPHLKFVVQDLQEVIEKATTGSSIPEELQSHIDLMVQDFLEPQQFMGDAYFFRLIFHDWPDSYVLKILRNLIPKLKDGAKIIITEPFIPPPGAVSLMAERLIRFFDMTMLSMLNGRERDEDDWKKLFHQADARFTNVKAWLPPGEAFSILEATWTAHALANLGGASDGQIQTSPT